MHLVDLPGTTQFGQHTVKLFSFFPLKSGAIPAHESIDSEQRNAKEKQRNESLGPRFDPAGLFHKVPLTVS